MIVWVQELKMLSFDDIKPKSKIDGLIPSHTAVIISAEIIDGTALDIVYKDSEGNLGSRILYKEDLTGITLNSDKSSWMFSANGKHLKMAVEACRIKLASYFDPYLAIHTSLVEPLPHQITAVYGEMLPRQPLRFLLADDPGSGKTVMAGLLIKELIVRSDVERCMIVVPGNLVEQWRDELWKKFKLDFKVLTPDMVSDTIAISGTGNSFNKTNYLIVRLDMLARNDRLKEKLQQGKEWDIVIVDEAHRMSATMSGAKISYTKRYHLGQELEKKCRHFLLMTATPHNGKKQDFQLFMALLDADRFQNRFRNDIQNAETTDIMRRLTKEELLTFEGKPLFPKREATTIAYELSPSEKQLYDAVTEYVITQMNRYTDKQKRQRVTFALLILQRRLASSTAAIHSSLERRYNKLQGELNQLEKTGHLPVKVSSYSSHDIEDIMENIDEYDQDEMDDIIESMVEGKDIEELRKEISTVRHLKQQASELKNSGEDTKWQELQKIFENDLLVNQDNGKFHKLIIFTESRDTIDYLVNKIRKHFGKNEMVDCIHGGIQQPQRLEIIERFMQDTDLIIIVANDAAGEGVNLQRGNLMINYDLPWNPNRLEQRFGRIHRIGQKETCYLWNLVATNTREGAVYATLLQKLEDISQAMHGRVFNILGNDLLEGVSLQNLLIEAIQRNEIEGAEYLNKIIGKIDINAVSKLMKERKLTKDIMSKKDVAIIYKEMQIAEAQRLQPYHVKEFFIDAFQHLGGTIKHREQGRYEIPKNKIPPNIIARQHLGLSGYERVCFDKTHINQQPVAAFITPGHPLLIAVIDEILEKYQELMKKGAIMVDEFNYNTKSRILFLIEHTIHDGRTTSMNKPQIISKKLQFAWLEENREVSDGGIAPHLDLRPIDDKEKEISIKALQQEWLKVNVEEDIKKFAINELARKHLEEIRKRRLSEIAKVEKEVIKRLLKEIENSQNRIRKFKKSERENSGFRLARENAERSLQEFEERLDYRVNLFKKERNLSALPPTIKGGILVVPQGLLDMKANNGKMSRAGANKKEIEELAMEAVMKHERKLGFDPEDVSAQKCGYDILSLNKAKDKCRFIEVKGREEGADTITATRNEIITSKNAPENYFLVIVLISNGIVNTPRYIKEPFTDVEPDGATVSVNFKIKELLAKEKNTS